VTSVGPLGNKGGGESLYVDMITWPAASRRGDRSWERDMEQGGHRIVFSKGNEPAILTLNCDINTCVTGF